MNLKEYYKEILNNLLMTEVTASPKNQPVDHGSLRATRVAALQKKGAEILGSQKFLGVKKDGSGHGLDSVIENPSRLKGANDAVHLRGARMIATAAAKGAHPPSGHGSDGELNRDGHGQRTKYAAASNALRKQSRVLSGDTRSAEARAKGASNAADSGAIRTAQGNRDRAAARREPGGDD